MSSTKKKCGCSSMWSLFGNKQKTNKRNNKKKTNRKKKTMRMRKFGKMRGG